MEIVHCPISALSDTSGKLYCDCCGYTKDLVYDMGESIFLCGTCADEIEEGKKVFKYGS